MKGRGFIGCSMHPQTLMSVFGMSLQAVLHACQSLKARLDKVKETMSGSPSWVDVVKKCFDEGIDLSEKTL